MIILDNEHCFKEDPEYGQMLKKMWSVDLTKQDRIRINTRVLGTNGLELPPKFQGMQKGNIFNFRFHCFSLIKSKRLFSSFKMKHVAYVQQTKNKIPSKQQFLKNI